MVPHLAVYVRSNQVVGVEIETQLGMMIIYLLVAFSGQMDHRPAMWDRFDDQAAVGGSVLAVSGEVNHGSRSRGPLHPASFSSSSSSSSSSES